MPRTSRPNSPLPVPETLTLNSSLTSRLMSEAFALQSIPSRDSGGQGLDIVFIDGFVGETIIGIHEDELHRTQPLRIDLAAGLPRNLACDTDHIGHTIDYGEVRTALKELLENHGVQLLEAFAEAVSTLLLSRFGAHWVRVRITKPRKFGDVEAVGVLIERSLRVQPRGDGSHSAEVLSLLGAGMVPGSKYR